MKTYIQDAIRTESKPDEAMLARMTTNIRSIHALFGLQTEIGELVDVFKRHVFYNKAPDFTNIKEELGDLLWYMAILMDVFEIDFEECMEANIAKLRARYPQKFDEQQAVERDLEKERVVLEAPVKRGGPYTPDFPIHDLPLVHNHDPSQKLEVTFNNVSGVGCPYCGHNVWTNWWGAGNAKCAQCGAEYHVSCEGGEFKASKVWPEGPPHRPGDCILGPPNPTNPPDGWAVARQIAGWMEGTLHDRALRQIDELQKMWEKGLKEDPGPPPVGPPLRRIPESELVRDVKSGCPYCGHTEHAGRKIISFPKETQGRGVYTSGFNEGLRRGLAVAKAIVLDSVLDKKDEVSALRLIENKKKEHGLT